MPLELQQVDTPPLSPERFEAVLEPAAWAAFGEILASSRALLEGRAVWNVNSTERGGGVAEMLRSIISYGRGAGIDMRWVVIDGTPEFFAVTKRLHNLLHGDAGDGGDLGAPERMVYEEVTQQNAAELTMQVRPNDIVLLHDPQTAGLASRLKECGAVVVWRNHVGAEQSNRLTDAAWEFLRPQIDQVDACVFSRHAYIPEWARDRRAAVIQPSIDAFSPKNQDMDETTARGILGHVGLLGAGAPQGVETTFSRADGSPARVERRCDVISTGPPPAADTPLVTQVSRWDRLKDPVGVMVGFAEHACEGTEAHLVLAGPNVNGVADDPEGAAVFGEVLAAWRALPHTRRARVHLASLPLADVDENAAIVNALQRQSTTVVQKSIQEGFGLTVAEAMWKSRAVVASAVGGIKDQVIDAETGVLIDDPHDLRQFGQTVRALLDDEATRRRLGHNAREHVRRNFLVDRHARQYLELLTAVLADERKTAAQRR